MTMSYDSSYHLLFSHPEMVEDLFAHFVDEPWVAQLDFSTLERINAKLHADGLSRREGDIIYKVRLRNGEEVYLYLLLEFQSQPDAWMAVRVLVYVGLLYQHLIREKALSPTGRLPPVFPLVLYNGDAPWSSPTALKDLISLPAQTPLWSWQPAIRYYLLEERLHAQAHEVSLTGILFQLEHVEQPQDLVRLVQALEGQLAGPEYASLRRAFVVWMKHVLVPAQHLPLAGHEFAELAEVKTMLASRLQQWEQKILEQGISKGIEQGIERGEAEILHRQLVRRFGELPEWAQARLASASREELERWGLTLLEAETLQAVFD